MGLVERLAQHGYGWTPPPNQNPTHPLLSAKRSGNHVYVSGQVPLLDGKIIAGKVGGNIDIETALRAAEICALNCLYAAGSVVDAENILGIVDVTVFVNCALGFTDTSAVANGASKFLIDLFGEPGKHARAAIGVLELPLDAAVEIKMVIEVR